MDDQIVVLAVRGGRTIAGLGEGTDRSWSQPLSRFHADNDLLGSDGTVIYSSNPRQGVQAYDVVTGRTRTIIDLEPDQEGQFTLQSGLLVGWLTGAGESVLRTYSLEGEVIDEVPGAETKAIMTEANEVVDSGPVALPPTE
ncbi:hypothetical protein FXB39_21195 [Nocardioides sp. BGMRC 2183]|nr:hypothetical protein FXB39_21195 [Nocardioides sp. BGMRC 2183]